MQSSLWSYGQVQLMLKIEDNEFADMSDWRRSMEGNYLGE